VADVQVEGQNVPTQIHLEPVAAPSILGLYALAATTFLVAAHQAGWFGTDRTAYYLLPFAAMMGGLAQFVAGMWAYKARDGVATALHGIWGAFWLAYALLGILFATGVVPMPTNYFVPELGYWLGAMAAITWVLCVAAAAENRSLAWVAGSLAVGSTIGAIGLFAGSYALAILAAYVFMISAVIAWYAASALMLDTAYGRVVWPVGKPALPDLSRVATGIGEPGVIRGQ
jgi:succinate-acetate transporter protein